MRLFVTGGGGFVGARFLAELAEHEPGCSVVRLTRATSSAPAAATSSSSHSIALDLGRAPIDPAVMEGVDCVVHLAATTGRADPQTYDRVNRKGTVDLATAAGEAGVRRFVFVSSVAASFHDKAFYPYAESKQAAEDALAALPLEVVVLRPTILRVFRAKPIASSTLAKSSLANATSSGPCIFGFTM